jgi:D-alanyl-D-alanine carboxypeptidase
MLPSGNDAAYVLAEHLGSWLCTIAEKPKPPVQQFITYMNAQAKELGL